MVAPVRKTVATPSAAYIEAASAWPAVRALMGGTRAMRLKRTTYLPQEPAETDTAYAIRLARTFLFNGFRKTVTDMAAKVFARPVELGDDVPAQLKRHAENINLAGQNLTVFAKEVFTDGLQTGISHILVEMPPPKPNATRRDDQNEGRRSYCVHIKAEDIIGWKSTFVNGRETLTQLRIEEWVTEPSAESPFEDVPVKQIRVLEPGMWFVYRKPNANTDDWIIHDQGFTSIDVIPLATVYLKRTGFMLGQPPLEDLADLNLEHWQSSSDQRNILHTARVPILFGAGMDDKVKLVVGPGTMARATHPEAKLEFVEHSGAAIGAGREDLKDIEFRMQVQGLQLLMPKPSGQTATGALIDREKENTPLALMAEALKDGLEQAYGFMALYEGLGDKDRAGGSATVNKDFGVTSRDATEITALIEMVKGGVLTRESALRELLRRGFLAEGFEIEDEVALLQKDEDDRAKRDIAMVEAQAVAKAAMRPEVSAKPAEAEV